VEIEYGDLHADEARYKQSTDIPGSDVGDQFEKTDEEDKDEDKEKESFAQELDLKMMLSERLENDSAVPETSEHEEEVETTSLPDYKEFEFTGKSDGRDENNNNSESRKTEPEQKRKARSPFKRLRKIRVSHKEHGNKHKKGTKQ